MCGIFGMAGVGCVDKTLAALRLLEYRGYDSAGISRRTGNALKISKCVGRVCNLVVSDKGNKSLSAIGHTRWATHGAVCKANAHPFRSADGNFSVVHNGVVDNHVALRNFLTHNGFSFASQTDSEVFAHLLQYNYCGDVFQSVLTTANMAEGSFAVALHSVYDDKLYAFKNKSPLVVGLSDDGSFVCSDIRCVSRWATSVAVAPDCSIAVLDKNSARFFDFDGNPLDVPFFAPEKFDVLPPDGEAMLSEIFAIPQCIRNAKDAYVAQGGIGLSNEFLKKIKRIYFVGCGTAYHSGLQTSFEARKLLPDVDVYPVVASEFVCDNYPVDEHTLGFFISQSGETADTLRAAEKFAEQGGYAYSVTNTDSSSLTFACRKSINVKAGSEYAVASTKAYNCQLVTLFLLVAEIASARGNADENFAKQALLAIDRAADVAQTLLAESNKIALLAQEVKDSSAVFFVGRAADYPTACEGSLKLKEVSYIHSEAFAAGELKHGSLALIERGVTVVAIATDFDLLDKNECTVAEVAARGARVVCVSPFDFDAETIRLPVVADYLWGLVAVIPLQLLAYYTAKALGRDIDRPRNLAKSVTVE